METQGFEELVRRAQAGDREAMDRVLEMLKPYLSRIAGPYANPLRPVDSTADLLQESCLRAWHKIGSFQGGKGDEHTFEMFRSWIGQIVRRLGKDARRDLNRQRRSPDGKVFRLGQPSPGSSTTGGVGIDPRGKEPSPSSNVMRSERSEKVLSALAGLDDEIDTAIVRMFFFERLPLTQIADRLGMSYMKVRDRYLKSMSQLQRELGDVI